MTLSLREVTLIAAEAGLDLRTVKRVLGERHRPMLATSRVLVNALITRGHVHLAAALERDGRVLVSQKEDSWDRTAGRPWSPPDARGKYTPRKKKLKSPRHP